MKKKLNIIAEIAQGFEGNFVQSKLLINAAAKAGANAVKFQLVYADELATPDYQYYELFKGLEMTKKQWGILNDYAISLGIDFIVDVFGEQSLKTAESVGIKSVKVHGTDVTNLGLLEAISASSIKTIILGIGGAFWGEIKNVLQLLKEKDLILLCGFQGYPTQTEDNHIARMSLIREKAKKVHTSFEMGFADHPGEDHHATTISLVAIGAGATTIEKHLTLGKVMEMEDYESALNPDEFRDFIIQIMTAHEAIGPSIDDEDFGMSVAEKTYRKNVRRDVVASKDIKPGEQLNSQNVTLKRTAQKNSINQLEAVLGKKANTPIKSSQPILTKNIN